MTKAASMGSTFLKHPKTLTSALALLLAAAPLLLFYPSTNFDFINFDDNIFIISNANVNSGISIDNLRWAFTSIYAGQWQPLTWISHMLDVELYGLDAGKHHLTSIIIHTISTLLFFYLLLLLKIKPTAAFLFAALWGVHPMRLESVAWISERKDLLSVFFGLCSLIFYKNFTCSKRPNIYYFLLVVSFTAGLLCKPIIITLPLLLLTLDYFILPKRANLLRLIIEKLPLIILSLASALISFQGQNQDQSLSSLALVPISDRASLVSTSYLAYFAKLFWPSGGAIFYPSIDYPAGVGAGATIGLIAIFILFFKLRQSAPHYLFGLLWLLISLLPVVGIIHIGGQALADRWTYFSHLGLLLACALGVQHYLNSKQDPPFPQNTFKISAINMGLLFVLIIFSSLTYLRLPHWKNSIEIFSYSLKVYPNNFLAHNNLGTAYNETGELKLAAQHLEEAVRLNPNYPEALNNLGIVRAKQGRINEARDLFEKALQIRPNFTAVVHNLSLIK